MCIKYDEYCTFAEIYIITYVNIVPASKARHFAFEVNKMGERGLLMAMAVERAGVPGGLDEGQVRGPCSVMNK